MFEGSLVGIMVSQVGLADRYVPNMLLAFLWASQVCEGGGGGKGSQGRVGTGARVGSAGRPGPGPSPGAGEAAPPGSKAWGIRPPQNSLPGADPRGDRCLRCPARQANAIPTAFWAVAFLLLPENAGYRRRVEEELAGPADGGAAPAAANERLLRLATDRGSLLRRCCAEAIRLRSPSVTVRVAAADAVLQLSSGAVLLRRGSVLAMSAYDLHADPRLFGATARGYAPERGPMLHRGRPCELHSAIVGVGGGTGLPFGGGKFRCPGRYLAEAEVALVLGVLLRARPGLRLAPGPRWAGGMGDPHGRLPPPDLTKMVGMKVPAGACRVVA